MCWVGLFLWCVCFFLWLCSEEFPERKEMSRLEKTNAPHPTRYFSARWQCHLNGKWMVDSVCVTCVCVSHYLCKRMFGWKRMQRLPIQNCTLKNINNVIIETFKDDLCWHNDNASTINNSGMFGTEDFGKKIQRLAT